MDGQALRERPDATVARPAEDLVSDGEARDLRAGLRHDAREIVAEREQGL